MLYQITDGTVSLGGNTILSHINFEIKGNEKIAIVGKNGAGKTTLLSLIAGELTLDRDDRRNGPGIYSSRRLTIEMLHQQTSLSDQEQTVETLLLAFCPKAADGILDEFAKERYEYEKEYDTLFTGFGFSKSDKQRRLSEFSGGEQTKIQLIRLLLQKPDILLLDEPTNHLDLETIQWLEEYIRRYDRAIVMVSHDRFFLDETTDIVYELSGNKLQRYPGNYSNYRKEKVKRIQLQTKAYEQQQAEIKRLEELIERFKHKPTKAAFARSRKKILERMERIEKPEHDDVHIFVGPITPEMISSKWVLETEHLKIGYDRPLLEMNLRIRRGQKVGILGPNGAGKTTFLKTIAGFLPVLSGVYKTGNHVTMGYFDQHSAQITSDKSVAEHFHEHFPALTEKEIRSVLGAFLFGGKAASTRVSALSGGEKARLVLAELLQSRPNFLILDEPTNHMDIQAKETLESAFQAYEGTILFVSHDRYFLRQVADCMIILEGEDVLYYPFGYEHYLEKRKKQEYGDTIPAQIRAEEQALIAGIRSVPKAERHRLREIPEEEAYADWKLRLAKEKLQAAQIQVENLWLKTETLQYEIAREIIEKDINDGRNDGSINITYQSLCTQYQLAEKDWHQACMDWYDIILELGLEITEAPAIGS